MADKRTVFTITANTWVRVVNGATAAKIRMIKSTVSYYSMAFTTGGETPTGDIPANPTAEKVFIKDIDEPVTDSAAVYLWLRCGPDQVGSVIVTL